MKFTAEYKQNLLNRLKMAKSYKETICIDPDVVTQLLQERERMAEALKQVVLSMHIDDFQSAYTAARETLVQVGELE